MSVITEEMKQALQKGLRALAEDYATNVSDKLSEAVEAGRMGLLTSCACAKPDGGEVSVFLMHSPPGHSATVLKIAQDPDAAVMALAVLEQIEREAGADIVEGILRRYAEHHKLDVKECSHTQTKHTGSIH